MLELSVTFSPMIDAPHSNVTQKNDYQTNELQVWIRERLKAKNVNRLYWEHLSKAETRAVGAKLSWGH